MEAITVKELLKLCEIEVHKGNGDKKILLSDDDEGNGFHELFFAFVSDKENLANLVGERFYDEPIENFVALG